ncbi:hypothetical protein [Streptomyces sp. NPDC059564]|uniref:hypothetical protein n=1 Tax=Streptomyces sp. NPDC059564 TaxID=3346865 RepID=UPI0036BD5449
MREVTFNAPRVLVRVETSYDAGATFNAEPFTQLWMTDRPGATDYRRGGQRWTWPELSRLEGWELGRRDNDELSEAFWIQRSSHVPAPHVEVRSRAVGSDVRHAMLASATRACLMVCSGGCRHDAQLLNAIGHQIPGQVDDRPTKVNGDRLQRPATEGAWRLACSEKGSVVVRLLEGGKQVVRLSLSGSQWTNERAEGAASALLKYVRR